MWWEENEIVLILALEIVSWTPGEESTTPKQQSTKTGVVVLHHLQPRVLAARSPPTVWSVQADEWQLSTANWGTVVDVKWSGMGDRSTSERFVVLSWYDQWGSVSNPEELEQQAHQRQKLLAARLRELGEDPDRLWSSWGEHLPLPRKRIVKLRSSQL